jgi:pimeloyl-ACP methyl ester carboxylesterase
LVYLTRTLVATIFLLSLTVPARSAQLESRFAKFGRTKVHYLNRGKGDAALVFIHGWACNADFWKPQMQDFPSLRLIAIDLAGHGQSDKPQVAYTMDYFARSMDAVLTDAKVKHAVLVGHSMGTPVIRQYYRLFPTKTDGLVIVDGALRLVVSKQQMDEFIAPLKANYQTAAPQMIEGLIGPVKDEKLKSEIRTAMLATPDYVAVSAMDGMTDEKIYETDQIKVPVLAVLVKSPFWPPDTEEFLRSLAPTLEVTMWDGVSHFLMMEKPREFDETVQTFLTQNKLLSK